jgi:hypothetical protein
MSAHNDFNDTTIEAAESLSKTLRQSAAAIENEIRNSIEVNKKTGNVLSFVSHLSLNGLSEIFSVTARNMRLFNDIGKIIDKLPEEFHALKKQYKEDIAEGNKDLQSKIDRVKEGIGLSKDDFNFIKWERRFREDEVKDKEDKQ